MATKYINTTYDSGTTPSISGTDGGTAVALDHGILAVYSKEILFTAQPILRFAQVATVKTELGALPGNTIKMIKYDAITGDDALVENTDIVPGNIQNEEIQIVVAEKGKGIAVSEFLLRSSFLNVMADTATLLGRHMAVAIDTLMCLTLYGQNSLTSNTAISQAVYSNGKAHSTITAADTFNTDMIREMVLKLAVAKAPKFNGDAYICYVHPQQAKDIRKDPAWINAQNYATPENILTGEIGRFEDVRFIETTQCPYAAAGSQDLYFDGNHTTYNKATSLTTNPSTAVYEAVMVGENCLGWAVGLPGEMRDNGVKDFGRRHEIAWYGIWGADIIEAANGVIGYSA